MAEEEAGTWLTREAYDRLKAELDELRGPWRREIAARIEAARAEGDLSENGGYHAAKDEQGVREARIRELEKLLRNAQVGEVTGEDGRASRGTLIKVTVAGREVDFLIGNREIGDGKVQVISEESPLGDAVIGHVAGEKVTYDAPNGRQLTAEIKSVEPYRG